MFVRKETQPLIFAPWAFPKPMVIISYKRVIREIKREPEETTHEGCRRLSGQSSPQELSDEVYPKLQVTAGRRIEPARR